MNKKSAPTHTSGTNQSARTNLRDEIMRYLSTHPDAADTIDGILDWWLPSGSYDRNERNNLLEVIKDMVKHGYIEAVPVGEEEKLYRLSRRVRSQF
jgi:hypothetical protein